MTKTLTQIDAPHSGADCHQCEELLPLANRLRELGLDAGIDPSTGGGVHVVYVELIEGASASYPDVYVFANIEGAGLYDQRQGDDHTLACEGVEQISFEEISDGTSYAAAAVEVEAMVARWRQAEAGDYLADWVEPIGPSAQAQADADYDARHQL